MASAVLKKAMLISENPHCSIYCHFSPKSSTFIEPPITKLSQRKRNYTMKMKPLAQFCDTLVCDHEVDSCILTCQTKSRVQISVIAGRQLKVSNLAPKLASV